jgi:DNA-binding transcriptional LysR family regulator
MMDVTRLGLLREFADRGSVAAVADATHQTASGVSQQLRRLEREAGLPLLEKRGRGLELTDAGRALVVTAVELATASARAEADWDEFKNNPAGRVSLASFPTGAEMLLPGVLRQIEELPGLDLTCTDIDRAAGAYFDLTADYDIVIAHSATLPQRTRSISVIPLMREPLDITVARTHRLADKNYVTLSELRGEQWIGDPYAYLTAATTLEPADQIAVRQNISDIRVTEAMVAADLGISLLPRYTASAALRNRIVYKELRGVTAERHITILQRVDRAERLAVRTVVRLIQAEAERVIEADRRRRQQ